MFKWIAGFVAVDALTLGVLLAPHGQSASAWQCTPVPTLTATIPASLTPLPTNTTVPTATPVPTETPKPSATAIPGSQTPVVATSTPIPTQTPILVPPAISPPQTGSGGYVRGESGCVDAQGTVHP